MSSSMLSANAPVLKASHSTEGTITNKFRVDVTLNEFRDWNGHEDPKKPYPREIKNGTTKGFRQLQDINGTSSGGLAYRTQDNKNNDVDVIIAWKNSANQKRVYTEIDDAQDINWDNIKRNLDISGEISESRKGGLKSLIKWKYDPDSNDSVELEVHFTPE